jgi:hypothetical protein
MGKHGRRKLLVIRNGSFFSGGHAFPALRTVVSQSQGQTRIGVRVARITPDASFRLLLRLPHALPRQTDCVARNEKADYRA